EVNMALGLIFSWSPAQAHGRPRTSRSGRPPLPSVKPKDDFHPHRPRRSASPAVSPSFCIASRNEGRAALPKRKAKPAWFDQFARGSYRNPVAFIVFAMSQDSTNVNPISIVMNRGNQAVFIPANIENGLVPNLVRAWKNLSQFDESGKAPVLDESIPVLERVRGIWMLLRKLIQPPACDDMHGNGFYRPKIFR